MTSYSRIPWRGIVVAPLLYLLIGGLAFAIEPCQFDQVAPKTRPNSEAGPTEVRIGVFIFDLAGIDVKTGEFTLDFLAAFSWQDPRLGELLKKTGRKICQIPIDAIWNPNMIPVNARVVKDELPLIVYIHPDGSVRGKQRKSGTFDVPFNLVDFPMDTQTLRVTYLSLGYGPDELKFVWEGVGRAESFSQTGFRVKLGRGTQGTYMLDIRPEQAGEKATESSTDKPSNSAVALARFDFEMEVTRDLAFYFWKIILPLFVIVLTSGSVFMIDPSQLGIQVGIGTSMLLTIIAFLFSLQNLLPAISYLTRLDIFVYSSLVVVFLVFVEALVSCTLAAHGKEALAHRLDWWSRRLYPLGYAMVITRFFWV